MKDQLFTFVSPDKSIFFLSWILCFSTALPHSIIPGKAGLISLLLFIFWIVEGNLRTKIYILYSNKLFLSILIFILFLFLSLLWTDYTNIGFAHLSAFKYYLFLIPVLITSLTKNDSLRLIHAFILGNILHAFLIILLSYKLIALPNNLNLYNPYSVYSVFFIFSSFYCFYYFLNNLNKKNIILSLIYLFCSLVFIYLIFTNKGRAGQIAFICSSIVTLILFHRNRKNSILILVVITIILGTLSSRIIKSTNIAAINEIKQILEGNYSGSWGARWGLLVTNFEIVKQNPILGVGLGDTKDEMQRVIERGGNQASYAVAFYDHPHNYYISILTSVGIIGFILYILIHIFLFKLPIKNTEIKYLSLIFLTTLIVNGITDNILIYKPYNIYFAIMIALFINLSLNEKDRNIESDNKL